MHKQRAVKGARPTRQRCGRLRLSAPISSLSVRFDAGGRVGSGDGSQNLERVAGQARSLSQDALLQAHSQCVLWYRGGKET